MLTVGAQELIEEVAAPDGKLSGEEDRYSGTDLYDFLANVEGSEALVDLLAPALEEADPELLATIREQFATLYEHLAELGSFEDGFVHYAEVTAGAEGRAGRRSRRAGRVARRCSTARSDWNDRADGRHPRHEPAIVLAGPARGAASGHRCRDAPSVHGGERCRGTQTAPAGGRRTRGDPSCRSAPTARPA